jgi:mannose-6-phosphate isomerase-like protein (cupin superfamily)
MNDSSQGSFATSLAPDNSVALSAALPGPFPSLDQPTALMPAEEIKRFIQLYASRPLFGDTAEWVIRDNPYRRPIDRKGVQQFDFSTPLAKGEAFSANALAAHRMLLNIYETDLIFLPENNFAAKKNDFSSYYSNDNKLLGELIRPTLEAHVFDFLEDEIDVTGKWSVEALNSYLQSLMTKHEQSELEVCSVVLSSADPQRACRSLMIQVAGDFLSEASASSRNILGKYGQIQSELFKIVIDDYGYGVHAAKHSTLFENTLATCGLISDLHAYWQFYLSSSLAINNYYHYVSRDHSKYFRAIGAIAVAESMFSHTCRKISEMLRAVFGKTVDTYYFDEHFHIDAHHGRMAFDYVVAPAIARHGDAVIPDIVRGMEELQLLTSLNDEDFTAQVAFAEAADNLKAQARQIHQQLREGKLQKPKMTLVENRSQSLVTRVCDQDKLYVVESGALELVIGLDQSMRLDRGEAIVVPRQRLHGTAVVSEECSYEIYDLGDYQSCLL